MRNPKTLLYYCINTLCCFFYRREYREFMRAVDSDEVQEELLNAILQQNSDTVYGRRYHFNKIDSIASYQEQVPLSDYEDYRTYIGKLQEEEGKFLTESKVITLEPTSGSTKAAKLVPYTGELKEEFQKGIKPWIYNLYTSFPEVRMGKSYWSITPAVTGKQYTKSGIPIGFEEDSEYFGRLEKFLMDRVFISPKGIKNETDMDRFYMRTVSELLKTRELTLISVWNPTYLLLLLDYLDLHKEDLLKQLGKSRRLEIQNAVYHKDYSKIWPRLSVISCWCDAYAASYAGTLRKLFPEVHIQPKGLLSTEGFISFPVEGVHNAALSIRSHFFEFIDLETKHVKLYQELETGKRYEVVITTGGGFYRYRTYDIVEVTGWFKRVPLLIFIGKNDRISDRFGEKLYEALIIEVMKELAPDVGFYMAAPQKDHYVLYIQGEKLPGSRAVDEALRRNFHYDYCRKLGQLKELRIFVLTGEPKKEYIEGCLHAGQKLGDIKPAFLSLKEDWDQFFTGYMV